MASGLIEIMKIAAMDAMESNQMCDLRVGSVVSTNPIKVQVTNQFTIPERLLIVPQHLTDYSVNTTVGETTNEMIIHNALKIGDKVALIRKTGGQSYFILDRI